METQDTAPKKRTGIEADPDRVTTPVLSVRLPSLEIRKAFAAKCIEDDIPIARFVSMVVEAYLDDRLRIIEPEQAPKPSFLVSRDQDQS